MTQRHACSIIHMGGKKDIKDSSIVSSIFLGCHCNIVNRDLYDVAMKTIFQSKSEQFHTTAELVLES